MISRRVIGEVGVVRRTVYISKDISCRRGWTTEGLRKSVLYLGPRQVVGAIGGRGVRSLALTLD